MSTASFPIGAFEAGMLQQLAAANAARVGDPAAPLLGYVIRQIAPYEGQLNGGPARLAQQIREVPAVWISFEDAQYDEASGLWTAVLSAICIARNARNMAAARAGAGTGEVGAYQIGKDVAGLLDGCFFIDGTTAMRCTRIDAPFNAEFENTRAAIVIVTFQAKWDPQEYGFAAGAVPTSPTLPDAEFATFDVGWEVPPFPAPLPPPPQSAAGASSAKAEDTITVPQGGN